MLKVLAFLLNFRAEPLRRDDRGITAVEYALLLAGVAVALIAGLKIFGPALGGEFSSFASFFP
jgi:pilus assembly protein Flp/PilA